MSDGNRLPPFGFPLPCPKCGAVSPPRLEYRPAHQEFIDDDVLQFLERMRHSCSSCGYSIMTAPLDAVP